MGCQHCQSAAGPACDLDRTLRHRPPPNVFGGVLMILATPLALGSLWAFVCAVLLCGIIAARLLDEERFLLRTCPVTKSTTGRFDTE